MPPNDTKTTAPNRGWAVRALLCAAVFVGGLRPIVSLAQAAPLPSAATRSAGTAPAAARSDSAPVPADSSERPAFGLLRPEDGSVVPLPKGTNYQDFLNWITANRGPGYGVNAVELTARPNDDRWISVDAVITVVVHRNDGWVRVPLAFQEALLTGFEHEGPGRFSADAPAKDAGQNWWFEGSGEHRLRLEFLVPMTSDDLGQRLTLTTPANAAMTKARLEVPQEMQATSAIGILRPGDGREGLAVYEWVGPAGRVDLTWRAKPVPATPADLAASTTIFPTVSGKVAQLRAVQRITCVQGQISSVRVQIPQGFSLVSIEGTRYRRHTEETIDGTRFVTVDLSEPTSGTFELTWRLTSPLSAAGSLSISGFSLTDVPADAQTGRIVIEQSTGYVVSRSDQGATQRVQALEMGDPSALAVSEAFEFTGQPFRLDLKVEPIAPAFSVTPELILSFLPGRLELDAKLGVEVTKGEVRETRLLWPASDWKLGQVRAGNVVEVRRSSDSHVVDLAIPSPVRSFSVPLRATRARETEGRLRLPLPRLEGASPRSNVLQKETLLCIRHPKQLAIDAVIAGDGALRRLDDDQSAMIALPEIGADERWTMFGASAQTTEVEFDVRRLTREVGGTVTTSIRARGDAAILVSEQLDFEVRHEPLSGLRLTIPAALADRIRFTFGSATVVPARLTDAGKEQIDVELPFGRPVIGKETITAQYDVPLPLNAGAASTSLTVPLVDWTTPAVPVRRLEVDRLPGYVVDVNNAPWHRLQTTAADAKSRWSAAAAADDITLDLSPRSEDSPLPYAVSRLLLRTVIDRDGAAHTQVDCRFERPPQLLAIRFPNRATPVPDSFVWRGSRARVDLVDVPGGRLVELPLPDGNEPAVLSFSYGSPTAGSSLGFGAVRSLGSLDFGDGVEVEQTLWRVTLPESHHLFTIPAGYEPRFHWGFQRGLWTRQPDESVRDVANWFGAAVANAGREFDSGHQYAFSRNEAAEPLTFTAITRSLVVLIGAGFAISIGYAFVNGLIRRTRLVLGALAVTLFLLWAFFPSQIQIFLQPAVFGFALVVAAAVVERAVRSRDEPSGNGSSPSGVDFVTILPGEDSTSAPPAGIGSEEPTVLRHGSPVETIGSPGDGSVR